MMAAALSLICPGAGQFLAGRPGRALYFFSLAGFAWIISCGLLGWIIHLCAALDAWHITSPSEDSSAHKPGAPTHKPTHKSVPHLRLVKPDPND